MKIEYRIFLLGVPFFAIAATVYGVWTSSKPSGWEPVGTLAIALTGLLVLMIGGYLALTSRRIDERPEDDPDAAVEDGAGDLGVYAPWSWWPLMIGASAAITFLGMAAGVWIMIIGIGLGSISLVGWVFEYSRGVHAH